MTLSFANRLSRTWMVSLFVVVTILFSVRDARSQSCTEKEVFPPRLAESELCALARTPVEERSRALKDSKTISPECRAIFEILLGMPSESATKELRPYWRAGLLTQAPSALNLDAMTSFTQNIHRFSRGVGAEDRAREAVPYIAELIKRDSSHFGVPESTMERAWYFSILSSSYFLGGGRFRCESFDGTSVELGSAGQGESRTWATQCIVSVLDVCEGTDLVFVRARVSGGMTHIIRIDRHNDKWQLAGIWPTIVN